MKKNKTPTYNMTMEQLKEIERKATDKAFILMLGIPTMVIHDKYKQLMPKVNREQTFVDLCFELYDSFNDGYVSMNDIIQTLKNEGGITIRSKGE